MRQVSLRDIAGQFRISKSAVLRHRDTHFSRSLKAARLANFKSSAETVFEQVERVRAKLFAMLNRAERAGDKRTMISAFREIRGYLELMSKLQKSQSESGASDIHLSPEWATIRVTITAALSSFPRAREAVARALCQMELSDATGA